MFNLISYLPSSEFEFLIKNTLIYLLFSDFGRYASQTEYAIDEIEQTQTQQKPLINNIPPLMSLSITPPPIITTNTQQNPPTPPSVIKEKYK